MEYKCYNTHEGCMGQTSEGTYQLFASEADYKEWYEDENKKEE